MPERDVAIHTFRSAMQELRQARALRQAERGSQMISYEQVLADLETACAAHEALLEHCANPGPAQVAQLRSRISEIRQVLEAKPEVTASQVAALNLTCGLLLKSIHATAMLPYARIPTN